MADRRFKNVSWNLPVDGRGAIATWDAVKLAVLMDIRDELQKLNRVFNCGNFLNVPNVLREISRNTAKPRRKRRKEV